MKNDLLIHLNNVYLSLQIRQFDNAAQGLDPSVESVSRPSKCYDIMLCEYADRLTQFHQVLEIYQQLVTKDCQDIRETARKMQEQDRNNGVLWNGISSEISTALRSKINSQSDGTSRSGKGGEKSGSYRKGQNMNKSGKEK